MIAPCAQASIAFAHLLFSKVLSEAPFTSAAAEVFVKLTDGRLRGAQLEGTVLLVLFKGFQALTVAEQVKHAEAGSLPMLCCCRVAAVLARGGARSGMYPRHCWTEEESGQGHEKEFCPWYWCPQLEWKLASCTRTVINSVGELRALFTVEEPKEVLWDPAVEEDNGPEGEHVEDNDEAVDLFPQYEAVDASVCTEECSEEEEDDNDVDDGPGESSAPAVQRADPAGGSPARANRDHCPECRRQGLKHNKKTQALASCSLGRCAAHPAEECKREHGLFGDRTVCSADQHPEWDWAVEQQNIKPDDKRDRAMATALKRRTMRKRTRHSADAEVFSASSMKKQKNAC